MAIAPFPSAAAIATSSQIDAGWSSPVARQAHNLKVVGSNPTPATTPSLVIELAGFCFFARSSIIARAKRGSPLQPLLDRVRTSERGPPQALSEFPLH